MILYENIKNVLQLMFIPKTKQRRRFLSKEELDKEYSRLTGYGLTHTRKILKEISPYVRYNKKEQCLEHIRDYKPDEWLCQCFALTHIIKRSSYHLNDIDFRVLKYICNKHHLYSVKKDYKGFMYESIRTIANALKLNRAEVQLSIHKLNFWFEGFVTSNTEGLTFNGELIESNFYNAPKERWMKIIARKLYTLIKEEDAQKHFEVVITPKLIKDLENKSGFTAEKELAELEELEGIITNPTSTSEEKTSAYLRLNKLMKRYEDREKAIRSNSQKKIVCQSYKEWEEKSFGMDANHLFEELSEKEKWLLFLSSKDHAKAIDNCRFCS